MTSEVEALHKVYRLVSLAMLRTGDQDAARTHVQMIPSATSDIQHENMTYTSEYTPCGVQEYYTQEQLPTRHGRLSATTKSVPPCSASSHNHFR